MRDRKERVEESREVIDLFVLFASRLLHSRQSPSANLNCLPNQHTMDTAAEGKDPSAFLGEIIGAPVTVKLNSGVIYKGQRPRRTPRRSF